MVLLLTAFMLLTAFGGQKHAQQRQYDDGTLCLHSNQCSKINQTLMLDNSGLR